MLRNLTVSVLALLVVAGGCARHTIPTVVLTPQSRIGPAEEYDLTIANVTPYDVDFNLAKPGYVIALRVTEGGGVRLVAPLDGKPRTKPGTHYLRTETVRSGGVTWVEESYWTPAFGLQPLCTGPADKRSAMGSLGCVDAPPYGPPAEEHRVRVPVYGRAWSALPGYWLVIVSDTPTAASEIWRRLATLDRSDTSLVNFVRALPQRLIASHTANWLASYAPFGTAEDIASHRVQKDP
jgi:hypothetical protein